jgi:acyl carrier protein
LGEIYLSGESLADGYINSPKQTSERFLPNPFATDGKRMYRTGDLGCLNFDGTLAYWGRSDSQRKIRGYRIELGEIEQAIRTGNLVRDVATTINIGPSGEPHIVCYYISNEKSDDVAKALKRTASEMLPEYMIPQWWIRLDQFPLNQNGKLDRTALPTPTYPPVVALEPVPATELTPAGAITKKLWESILRVGGIDLDGNFFEHGGTSILAVKLVHSINQELNCTITIKDFITASSLRRLIDRIEELSTTISVHSNQ